jgi:hypothetical protein
VNIWLATVIAAVFVDVPVFAATEYVTFPEPVPELPEVTVSHDGAPDTFHVHPVWVVTDTLPVPPDEPNDWLAGEMAYVHVLGSLPLPPLVDVVVPPPPPPAVDEVEVRK